MTRTADRASDRPVKRLSAKVYRWLLAGVLLAMLAAVRAANPTERDQYWSARAGLETFTGTPLARQDNWSWSTDGIWYPNSPAWNVILGLGWQSLGFWGLFWVAFLSMMLLFGLALLAARAAGARALPTLVAFVPILVIASAALSPRATVVVQSLILASVVFAWWWGGVVQRTSSIVSVAIVAAAGFALSLVGNWVHLSFLFIAAAIAVMWGIAWWLSPGIGALRRVALTVAGTVGLAVGCVLSPYGIPVTLERAQVVGEISQGLVVEWTSVFSAVGRGDLRWLLVGAFAAGLAVGSAFWLVNFIRSNGRFHDRARLLVPLAVFAVPMTLAGLSAIRFLALGLLALLPVAAAAATGVVDAVHERRRLGGPLARRKMGQYTSGRFWAVVFTGVAVVLTPVVGVVVASGARPAEAAIAESIPQGCSVFTDAQTAGTLILTRPGIEVWIDGRVDFYGRQHLIDTLRIYSARDPLPEQATCVVLATSGPTAAKLRDAIAADDTWTLADQADGYALWLRG